MYKMGTFGIIMLVLSAAMSAIGTGLNFYYQDKTNKEQMDFAREQQQNQQAFEQQAAKTANDRSLQMFYQTQSPQAKMEMIKNAGLSPGLIYGGGAATQGSAAAAAKASSNAIPMPNIQSPFNADYLNQLSSVMNQMADSSTERKKKEEETKETSAKINEIIANTKKLEEETKTNVVTRNYTEIQTKLAELDLEYQNATMKDRINIVEQELNQLQQNVNLTRQQIKGQRIDNQYKARMYESTLQLNEETRKKIIQDKLLVIAQQALAEQQTELVKRQQAWTDADKELKETQRDYTNIDMQRLQEIVNEYQQFGYKVTESPNWQMELISIIKKVFGDLEKERPKGKDPEHKIFPDGFGFRDKWQK